MQNIEKIYIDRTVKDEKYTKQIVRHFPDILTEVIDDTRTLFDAINQAADPITAGKKVLLIENNKGAFLKKCPGTKEYICCGYQILNFSTQCNLECTYCILQAYFNNPVIRIFANLDTMMQELTEKIDADPTRLWRIGTGEFTDSLSLESITGFSQYIIPFFAKRPNTLLELKTKTSDVAFLKQFDPRDRIMLSFSLNAEHIQQNEEKKSSTIHERIAAAKICHDHGYRISFHFDPIIYYEGWERDYQKTIDALYGTIDPNTISWMSIGCFRFMPALKETIMKRHPESSIIYGEFIKGLDGKMRYPKPLRIKIYRTMAKMLDFKKYDYKLYFCMESDEVWRKSLGFSPGNSASLKHYLDEAVF